jgi:hypothetical protein
MSLRRALCCLLLLGVLAVPAARADGDPASDVLLANRVFLSIEDPSASPQGRELEQLTLEAEKRHLPIRIAVIATAVDLGAVPELFGKAQTYATFLSKELTFVYRGTLVVVMAGKPGGVGITGKGATPAAKAALGQIRGLEHGSPRELAMIASRATRIVAAKAGITLKTARASANGGGTSSLTTALVVALPVLALAGAIGLRWFLRRSGQNA